MYHLAAVSWRNMKASILAKTIMYHYMYPCVPLPLHYLVCVHMCPMYMYMYVCMFMRAKCVE